MLAGAGGGRPERRRVHCRGARGRDEALKGRVGRRGRRCKRGCTRQCAARLRTCRRGSDNCHAIEGGLYTLPIPKEARAREVHKEESAQPLPQRLIIQVCHTDIKDIDGMLMTQRKGLGWLCQR